MMKCVIVAMALLLASVGASAQWLKYPTPGIPRTADGKPDLSAPAPRGAGREARLVGNLDSSGSRARLGPPHSFVRAASSRIRT